MQSEHSLKSVSIDDPRYLNTLVTKLIRNKMQPLSYKHYALKTLSNTNSQYGTSEKKPLPIILTNRKDEKK
jgi:hypothetical protein